jgi:hypothetical protein
MNNKLRKEIEKSYKTMLKVEGYPDECFITENYGFYDSVINWAVAEIEKRINEPKSCDNCSSKYSAANCHGCVNSENWRAKT